MNLKRVAMYGAAAAGIILARRLRSTTGVAADRGRGVNRLDQGLRDTEVRRTSQVRSALGVAPSGSDISDRRATRSSLDDSSDIFQSP